MTMMILVIIVIIIITDPIIAVAQSLWAYGRHKVQNSVFWSSINPFNTFCHHLPDAYFSPQNVPKPLTAGL